LTHFQNFEIKMPHRYQLTYEQDTQLLTFEIELLSNGVLLYPTSAKRVIGESLVTSEEIEKRLQNWLEAKFKYVEIDHS